MATSETCSCKPVRIALSRGCSRLRRDEDGATAVEFAGFGSLFFMIVFGLVGMAFYFFIMNSIEKGMDQTARLIRTGQSNNPAIFGEGGMTVKQFKELICASGGAWIKCDKLQIWPDKSDTWAEVRPEPCVENGVARINPADDNDKISEYTGDDNDIVVVTACYRWFLPASLPYLKFGNMSDGSHMMQAATAFRAEPYEPIN